MRAIIAGSGSHPHHNGFIVEMLFAVTPGEAVVSPDGRQFRSMAYPAHMVESLGSLFTSQGVTSRFAIVADRCLKRIDGTGLEDRTVEAAQAVTAMRHAMKSRGTA